jgi:hypothetical protein
MNHHSRLPIEIEIIRHRGQSVLRFQFHRDALRDWCLGLCLLKEGLVEAFTTIEQRARGSKVKFVVGTHVGPKSQITLDAQSSEVVLTENNLDYVQHFFLKYYRDGVAEVDHLDLEAVDTKTEDSDIYITFHL